MTARPYLDERDPQPPRPWQETSQPGIRRMAKQQVEAAVRRAKDSRKKPLEPAGQQDTEKETDR